MGLLQKFRKTPLSEREEILEHLQDLINLSFGSYDHSPIDKKLERIMKDDLLNLLKKYETRLKNVAIDSSLKEDNTLFFTIRANNAFILHVTFHPQRKLVNIE